MSHGNVLLDRIGKPPGPYAIAEFSGTVMDYIKLGDAKDSVYMNVCNFPDIHTKHHLESN